MSKVLRDVCHFSYGKSQKEVAVKKSEIPVVGTGGIVGYASRALFKGPMIVVGRKGTLDKPQYIKKDSWIIDTAYAVHPKGNINLKWLYYYLLSIDLLKYNEATGVPSLNREFIYDTPVPEISADKQKEAVKLLENSDECIDQTRKLISKMNQIKKGLLHDLFHFGINEKGQLRKDEHQTNWTYKNLKELVDFYSGYAFKNKELSESGIKITRISNLSKPDFPYWKYSGLIRESIVARDGDVLFTWAGVASSVDIHLYRGEDTLLNQHIYNFKCDDKILLYYVYYYIKSFLPTLRESIEGGAGQLHLTKDKIEQIKIPIQERKEMESTLEKLKYIDRIIEEEKMLLKKYQRIRDALIIKLMKRETHE